ncbi:MAG: PLP-dependent aminotransferase family protein [Myxococcales bacterium]|nr:PLP-dependent aminotransferase family protein [Myxococcales bacterium]
MDQNLFFNRTSRSTRYTPGVTEWRLNLELAKGEQGDERTLVTRIARTISADIARGRLRPGARLPGTRSLAQALGVGRGTVVTAYDELAAEGWVRGEPARGTFVAELPVVARPRRFAPAAGQRASVPTRAGFELGPLPPGLADVPGDDELLDELDLPYNLSGGLPDTALAPASALARAYRRAITRRGAALLDYGDGRGHPRLRAALAAMLATSRGLATDADDVLITRGSQMALWLIALALSRSGDARVAVERLGYRPAWQAMRACGATLQPVAVDDEGLDVDALAASIEQDLSSRSSSSTGAPPRAIYVTPHHQYPTTVTLSAPRRLRLLELARRRRVAIIEDDYDNEFHYEGRPVLPLASADRSGVVVYVGTLSKVVAPGLRIGYVVAPRPLLERLARLRRVIDRQGDLATEAAVAELIEEGELQRHVWRMRRAYHARRDALAAALTRELGGTLEFTVPRGGMSMWARVDPRVDVERWAARAREREVLVRPGRMYMFQPATCPHLRLGFARLPEPALLEGVRRLAAARPRRARG